MLKNWIATFVSLVTSGIFVPIAHTQKPLYIDSAISLTGEWQFRLDPGDVGVTEEWFNRSSFPHTISLPGTTDEAKYGTKTVGAIPMVLTRVYRYYGAAWYGREITIPKSWNGKFVNLFLERVIFQSRVWIAGRLVGSLDSLTTPHVHELGVLTSGKHHLAIRIDNRPAESIGVDGHGYSEFTQTIWNGVVGRIELQAHHPVFIGLVRAFGDAKIKNASVETTLENRSGAAQKGTLTITIREKETGKEIGEQIVPVTIPKTGTTLTPTVSLTTIPKLWDEFSPHLYIAEVRLLASRTSDVKTVSFGFRILAHDKHHVTINDQSIFIRGNIDHSIYPLTGYPPTTIGGWRRVFRIYKNYGMNAVRFHSWTPPEAAFDAADEMGIYIQTEICWFQYPLGSGQPFGKQPLHGRGDLPQEFSYFAGSPDEFVRTEMRRVLDTYGNHPSFVFFVIGNELGHSIWNVTGKWIGEEKAHDQRHLYAASTARAITPEDDFNDTHAVHDVGLVSDRLEPYNSWDYEDHYSRAPVPVIAHELGQWPTYPRWSSLKEYTGVLQPRNLERYKAEAKAQGIYDENEAFHLASNALALLLYKDEMESHLRTPDCLGYSTLDMQDYPGQGEALVGWLDAFYVPKGHITPKRFRRWNNSVVVLARLPSYVWRAGEPITGSSLLANYDRADFANVESGWRLLDRKGVLIKSGTFANVTSLAGKLTALGSFTIPTTPFRSASQVRLELFAKCNDKEFANDWDLWIYPALLQPATFPTSIVVTDSREDAAAALFVGKTVLLDAHAIGDKTNERIASFKPTYWSAAYFPGALTLGALIHSKHPALAEFPTDDHYDWQWADLCKNGRGFILDALPQGYRSIVQPIPDFHLNRRYGTIFDLRSQAGGRLLVSGYDISSNLDQRLPATQLRLSLMHYVASSQFRPQQIVTPSQFDAIFPKDKSC